MSFKPFGGWEYGYPDYPTIDNNLGHLMWALQTAGTLGVDWREALLVLGVGLGLQETGFLSPPEILSQGSSFVWNIQLGYLLIRMFRRFNGKLPLWVKLVVGLGVAGDIWGYFRTDVKINNVAHGKGLAVGVAAALLFDFRKKRPLV